MPNELIIIAMAALLAGLLFMAIMLAGRRPNTPDGVTSMPVPAVRGAGMLAAGSTTGNGTLRVAWWLTIAIVVLGVGISGSFASDQVPIFILGAAAVLAVVVFHETAAAARVVRIVRAVELVVAVLFVAVLMLLTGHAASPFAMLFALVAVAAALAHGPRAGVVAATLATLGFATVLALDPALGTYRPEDALRLSVGLVATWLLAFVAIAYAGHQRRTMQSILDVSRIDPLTGLLNRSQLFVTLEQEVSRTRRSDRGFCVLMIDLDGLKAINDGAGHLRGDEVLRALGNVIAGSIRTVDSAYRFGGDEFVVLLPETDIVGAFFVAEKIRIGAEELGMALSTGDQPTTSVSIGLVSHPEDGTVAEQLIAAADRAMYEAKKLGKNQISGNPRPRPALLARRSVPPVDEPPPDPPAPAEPPPIAPAPAEPAPAAPSAGDPPVAAMIGVNGSGFGAGAEIEAPATPSPTVGIGLADGPIRQPVVIDDDEPDALVVRRNIAAASRAFDPDHQIRRAMDAFLSPGLGEREIPPKEH